MIYCNNCNGWNQLKTEAFMNSNPWDYSDYVEVELCAGCNKANGIDHNRPYYRKPTIDRIVLVAEDDIPF